MGAYYILYYSLIAIAIFLSFVAVYNGHKRYFPILIILVLTEILELLVELAIFKKMPFVWSYHVFITIEYSLFSLYFINIPDLLRFRNIITISIPLFISFSLGISFFFYHFKNFPGININTAGLLLFTICSTLLFNLEVRKNEPMFINPDVWICLGILIFFGGTFFYNGIYSKLLNIDENKAIELFGIINKPLNICFYLSIIIGLLCLKLRKKYSIQ